MQSFDATTRHQSYRDPLPSEAAETKIQSNPERQFDLLGDLRTTVSSQMTVSPERRSAVDWVEEACRFLKFGYRIVPIRPMSGLSQGTADPVVQHLGAEPLVDPTNDAASTEAEIKELAERFEEARIGARTGPESSLLAIELKKGKAEDCGFSDRVASFAEGAPGIVSASREYILFPYPSVEEPLPPITEKKGAVLHGDGSIIFLPGSRFEWKDRFFDENGEVPQRDERRRHAREVLSLFGLADHLAPEAETLPKGVGTSEANTNKAKMSRADPSPTSESEDAREGPSRLDLPLGERRSNGPHSGEGSTLPFRTGDELRRTSNRGGERLNLPWTIPGGLSVLTGPPKTAGKSSWVVNLTAHLAAGKPFLEYEIPSSEVVLLADSPPAAFRDSLARLQFLEENARSRLHVLHPSDVRSRDWLTTLLQAYEHARAIGADLLVIDCLDRYIQLKGGPPSTESEDVAQMLTAESPPDCPVLSVQSTNCSADEPIFRTIERLGILGLSADVVLRLDIVSTDQFPCLRRLVTAGRQGCVFQRHACALRSGRYVRVRREDLAGRSTESLLSEPALPDGIAAANAGPDPALVP